MKVLIAESVAEEGIERLRSEPDIEVVVELNPSPERLLELVTDCEGLIVRGATRVTRRVLESAARLRIVGRAGSGVDNIDVAAATERGVVVVNAPGGNAVSVAELALALLLACARRIAFADAAMKRGRWEKKECRGCELNGKTLGLIGLGRIGREVALRAAAFGMKLLGYDPFVAREQLEEMGVELAELDRLLALSHAVSLHVPLTDRTRALIGRQAIERMRPGAILINAARGGLVDEEALLEALNSGKIAAAGLDVFEGEPSPRPELVGHPAVVATPHIGASTQEAQEQVGYHVAGAVADFLARGVVQNAVNYLSLSAEEARLLGPYFSLASRLGQFAAQAASGRMTRIRATYQGELAQGRYQALTDHLLCGALRPFLHGVDVNPVSARSLAAGRDLGVIEASSDWPCEFSAKISVRLETEGESVELEGTAEGKGRPPRLLAVDGLDLDAPLEGPVLFFRNEDVPGVVGRLGTLLGEAGVNIVNLALRSDGRGGAAGLARLDRAIDEETRRRVRSLPGVRRARMIDLS